MAADTNRSENEHRIIYQAIDALQRGRYIRAVTNANILTEDDPETNREQIIKDLQNKKYLTPEQEELLSNLKQPEDKFLKDVSSKLQQEGIEFIDVVR